MTRFAESLSMGLILRQLLGKHTQKINLAMHVEGCSHANPFHTVVHCGCIQWGFVCIGTTKYHSCCGPKRHVVQCIELLLKVLQVGFCASEHNMQSTLPGSLPLSVREQMNLEIFGADSSYTALCSGSANLYE